LATIPPSNPSQEIASAKVTIINKRREFIVSDTLLWKTEDQPTRTYHASLMTIRQRCTVLVVMPHVRRIRAVNVGRGIAFSKSGTNGS
jgi:hypothetical protein